MGFSGAACAAAQAGDPVLAVTAAGQLLTFDPDAPGTTGPAVAPSGVAGGDRLMAIGNTGSYVEGLGTSGALYSVNLGSGAAVARTSPLAGTALAAGVGIAYGPLRQPEVILADGSLCSDFAGGCIPAPPDPSTGRPARLLAAAVAPITGPPLPFSATPQPLVYAVDAATASLVTLDQPPYGVGPRTVGPLGLTVTAPAALAVSRDATRAFLVTGSPVQSEYSVNLATGAATLIGPIGPPVIAAMTTIPPATITQNDPVTGAYPLPASPGLSHGPVTGVPNPAVEGHDQAFAVPVNRAGDPAGTVSVRYTAGAPGDPAAGLDYLPVSGTVSLAAGQQYASFSVPVLAGPAQPNPVGEVEVALTLGGVTGALDTLLPGSVGYEIVQQTGHVAKPAPLTPTPLLLAGLARTETITGVLAHGLAVPITCALACSARVSATTAARAGAGAGAGALGSRSLKLARPGTYVIHLRLSARARRTLRLTRRAVVEVVGRARFASGAGVSDHARLTLRRR
ncbi:MAG: hypothetical protein QOF77_1450 [Solirubrobacteraceae bacterium]|nr:hypothetical protein [Solirubrobacteraceae bacterium]